MVPPLRLCHPLMAMYGLSFQMLPKKCGNGLLMVFSDKWEKWDCYNPRWNPLLEHLFVLEPPLEPLLEPLPAPYPTARTPFQWTLVALKPLLALLTVPLRALRYPPPLSSWPRCTHIGTGTCTCTIA